MFATTPRLRELLDLRTAVLVAAVALVAFALQLGFLAGTVARPLGEAIASFETVPQLDRLPAGQAYAGADAGRVRPVPPGEEQLRGAPIAGAAHAVLPTECLVYR